MPEPAATQESAVAPPLAIDGRPLQSAGDVAAFFDVPPYQLTYALYRSDEDARYTEFEIPKRSGGKRRISSPTGLIRQLQTALAPRLKAAYSAHPSAHGFIVGRSTLSNARVHERRRWVLNIDLKDFFPSVNFGRVRGLFMAEPFRCGPAAATVLAQLCTHRNGLPQGAPTSPVLSNFIATALDRRLTRLARSSRLEYSRYADDITFSTDLAQFPPAVATFEIKGEGRVEVVIGDALEAAVSACGFAINPAKVRIQRRHMRQEVTGLTVNERANVERVRIRKVRAMLYAWAKFGLEAAAAEHYLRYGGRTREPLPEHRKAKAFRNLVYGHLAYIQMVRGRSDPVYLRLVSRLVGLDPNPTRLLREIAFGASNYEVFISHAGEDKAAIARPVFAACERLGLKCFLDEEHIAWGQPFTAKINSALGAARTVLAIVSPTSVGKEWPVLEVNTALTLEVAREKKVVVLLVGKPDLTSLPLLRAKDYMIWDGNADDVARELVKVVRGAPKAATSGVPLVAPPPGPPRAEPAAVTEGQDSSAVAPRAGPEVPPRQRSWLRRLFGGR